MTATREDVYARVTNAIVADLEKGVRPWHRPWDAKHAAGRIVRPLRSGGEPYKGVNVLILWAAAESQGFTCPTWMTFRQAKLLGGSVARGAKGTQIVYADRITRTETADSGEEMERDVYFMKAYTVFNAVQVEGLAPHFYDVPAPLLPREERHERAERFVARTGATVCHGGGRAFYAPHPDVVQMPPFAAFEEPGGYYATLAHELTHWTKHPSRLARDLGGKRFGDDGYAREELVAEIGAAFLCCDLGLDAHPREDHASYLGHWLAVLKADKRAIFRAAAQAQKAADFLHGLQPQGQTAAA